MTSDEDHHPSPITFRLCTANDVDACFALEAASYPRDEAASLESLRFRFEHAGDYFLCAFHSTTLLGFVCGTRCDAFVHETMSRHHTPTGTLLAIHSVVIAKEYRRKGYATRMLQHYLTTITSQQSTTLSHTIQRVVLLAKAHLLAFYVQCGFTVLQPSAIEHGAEQWYDLERQLMPRCFIVDAFCAPPETNNSGGTGNPAAVVLLSPCNETTTTSDNHHAGWMQQVAAEFNLSETAFLTPIDKKTNGCYRIRYFTPTIEVDLCGHATLGSAAAVFDSDMALETIEFVANQNVLLTATREAHGHISMEFPQCPVSDLNKADTVAVQSMLKEAFQIDPSEILYTGISKRLGDVLIEVTNEALLVNLKQDTMNLDALMHWDGYSCGVIVCSTSSSSNDFVSRFFGPKCGIIPSLDRPIVRCRSTLDGSFKRQS